MSLALRTTPWLLVAVVSCSSQPGSTSETFPAEPFLTSASDSGKLNVEFRTSPAQPPTRGNQAVQLVVTDAQTHAPAAGLAIEVTPWMPAHGHGGSVTPRVVEVEPGIYVASDVNLFMPGAWQLRTTFSGALSDHVEPTLDVP